MVQYKVRPTPTNHIIAGPDLNRAGPRRIARNSQWGAVLGVWRRSPQPPEAGGLGAKVPAAGGTGVRMWSPQHSKILRFLAKITKF